MCYRMASWLETQKLSEQGIEAFGQWLRKLTWDESLWLATLTYNMRGRFMLTMDDVFFNHYPTLIEERILVEDALFREMRRLSDQLPLFNAS